MKLGWNETNLWTRPSPLVCYSVLYYMYISWKLCVSCLCVRSQIVCGLISYERFPNGEFQVWIENFGMFECLLLLKLMLIWFFSYNNKVSLFLIEYYVICSTGLESYIFTSMHQRNKFSLGNQNKFSSIINLTI